MSQARLQNHNISTVNFTTRQSQIADFAQFAAITYTDYDVRKLCTMPPQS